MSILQQLLSGGAVTPPPPEPTPAQAATTAAVAATGVLQPSGSPEQDLQNLLAGFAAAHGTAPLVNPVEAAKVIATQTAPEVAGRPEPPEDEGPVVEPPTSKPVDVLAAEAAPRPRRTAAVVQAELDLLTEAYQKLGSEHQALKGEVAGYAEKVRQEFAGETKLLESDKAKAYARAEELEKKLEASEELNRRAGEAIKVLQSKATQVEYRPAPAAPAKALADHSVAELGKALSGMGFKVLLEVIP